MSRTAEPTLTYCAPPERRPLEEIDASAAALRADGQLAAVLDAVASPVFVLNGERQVLFGNAAARRTAEALGTDPIGGRRPGEILTCRNAATAPSGCGTGRACRTCGALNAIVSALDGRGATHECHIGTVGGDALDFRVKATPFAWQGLGYVLLVLDDVSDAKRREVLERTFFHDILNTAGGISGIAGLIADDPNATAEFRQDLLASATLLVNEIKCQRMLLSAEEGELVVVPSATNARTLLERVQGLYEHHPVAARRRVELAEPVADVPLVTDETIAARVLGNLVKNALEAAAPGEAVTLGATGAPGTCTFWCHNPGVIPDAAQLQVFLRSFSTKGPGRGIGTYSVRLLTERYLGGKVGFTSTRAAGTVFEVTLPTSTHEAARSA